MPVKHIAASGKNQGKWVTCSARKNCRNGGAHLDSELLKQVSDKTYTPMRDLTEEDVKVFVKTQDELAALSLEKSESLNKSRPPLPILSSALNSPRYFEAEYTSSSYGDDDFEIDVDYADYYDEIPNSAEIKKVNNLEEIMRRIYGSPYDYKFSEEEINTAKELGLDKPESYTASIISGYYGDYEKSVEIKPEIHEALNKAYYERPDAVDDAGILSYCRSKGQETAGLSPIEALKKQLTFENDGVLDPRLKDVDHITKQQISLAAVNISGDEKAKYRNADPAMSIAFQPEGAQGNRLQRNASFEGVLFADETNKKYLVDGFRRVKALREASPEPRVRGTFIVLAKSRKNKNEV